jgi:DNA-binding GntR family transcriptional regulator
LSSETTTAKKPSASLTDSAYAILRRQIITCALAPGEVVTEARLAADIGLGKTPTRDALARLASEGLVQPMTRKGYEVLPLTIGDVAHLYETFRIIGSAAAALVAERGSPETIKRLRTVSWEWAPEEGARPAEPDEVRAAPFALVFEAAGNPIVAEMARPVVARFERLMNFALLHGSWADREHAELRAAVHEAWERRDAEAAREAMLALLDFGEQEVARILVSLDAVRNAPLTAAR